MMARGKQTTTFPSAHTLLGDAYAILGSELERVRSIDSDPSLDAEQKASIYKQSNLKADTLVKLLRALGALREQETSINAGAVDGKPLDSLSDSDVLRALLQNIPREEIYRLLNEQPEAPVRRDVLVPTPYGRRDGSDE